VRKRWILCSLLGGQGGKVECLGREYRAYNIFAGSEEIMLDQGMKMALSEYQKRLKRLNAKL
jgi:hypothetical protein